MIYTGYACHVCIESDFMQQRNAFQQCKSPFPAANHQFQHPWSQDNSLMECTLQGTSASWATVYKPVLPTHTRLAVKREDCEALAGFPSHAGARDVPTPPHAPAHEVCKEWSAAEHGEHFIFILLAFQIRQQVGCWSNVAGKWHEVLVFS